MSYAIQKRSGSELNRLYEEDTLIHDWYRFVLSYPPHLVKDYLHKFGIEKRHCVLDPFCGTGTTLVECKKLGIPSIGVEANPVVHLMADTKTNWDINPQELVVHADAVAAETLRRLKGSGDELKSLPLEKENLIIEGSISPIPLHKSLMLLEVMNELHDARFSGYERTAFAKQLVFSSSNLRFGPEVGISRKKKLDAQVVENWLDQVKEMADNVAFFSRRKNAPSMVHLADSRELGRVLQHESIDALICSPPYPNEKDYTRTTRLESVLLGFISDRQDLKRHKAGLLRSNTRNVYKNDMDEIWIADNGRILELANSIEKKRIELGKTSGFERLYHKVVKLYFGGMARHLEELKPKLRSGAKLAYVVGDQASYFRILIPTGEIFADIARRAGYEVLGIDLFRTRLSTATKHQLREEVVLLKWNG